MRQLRHGYCLRVGGDDRVEQRKPAFTQCPELTVVLLHTDQATCGITLNMWRRRCSSRTCCRSEGLEARLLGLDSALLPAIVAGTIPAT